MLKITEISKTFNQGTINEKRALCKVSLTMQDGDFATIVGSNGAGKSTLFNAIAGTFITDEGSIILDGKDITFEKEHRRSRMIGRLFQDPLMGTAPHMSIEENLSVAYLRASAEKTSFFGKIAQDFTGITAKERKVFREKLSLLNMGLEDRMENPVGLLSGGQRQALTLLMATIVTPRLLLLDEHTAALDPATADKVLDLTKRVVQEKNITCLMITHNMKQALELGNRTLMMDSGRIVLDIKGEERKHTSVEDLLELFAKNAGAALDNDRILLSSEKAV
ncbi:MAG: ATP-binding cassette domain-containing protein [Lachnospiraceae bacterium]|nr:ATP-binding cassette domain-containing protein [Lachnospiraceae bacterium]